MQAKNLPTIAARYWVAILVASMAGANMGDFVSNILHLGHLRGLLPLALIFSAILWAERRARSASEAYYWLAIIVVRTAATNLADLANHDLALGYGLIESGLAALLVIILLAGHAWGQPSCAGGQKLPATDAPYWAAMLVAGTLGTATGDWVSGHLGFGVGSLVLAAIYLIVLLIAFRVSVRVFGGVGGMTKPWYWASIVAARTAGTTMGDLVANDPRLHLGLSLGSTLTCGLLAGIALLWRDKSAVATGET